MTIHLAILEKTKKLLQPGGFKAVIPYLKSKLHAKRRALYELLGNDSLSKPYLGHKKLLDYISKYNGFFIEVGGNDGYRDDPSYYLEKFRGWNGVIIEPLSISGQCQRNRKKSHVIRAAMVSSDFPENSITLIDCGAMSIIKDGVPDYKAWIAEGEKCQNIKAREVVVPALTLDSVLTGYFSNHRKQPIDLLIMDVEGYESEVLKGLDLNKYSPEYILLELILPELKIKIEEYFGERYLLVGKITNGDFLYQRAK